jgi:hypothetical protein
MRQLTELQEVLALLLDEHRKLLTHLETQYAAMKKLDVKTMTESATAQESTRLRINSLETRRRGIAQQIAQATKTKGDLTVSRLMEMFPASAAAFGKLRTDLRDIAAKITHRTFLASKLAGSVCGHLNTALRLLASAVERAGLYTRDGVPRVATRIGVMDAVG